MDSIEISIFKEKGDAQELRLARKYSLSNIYCKTLL